MSYRIKKRPTNVNPAAFGAHSRDAPGCCGSLLRPLFSPEEPHVSDFNNNSSLTLCDLPDRKPGKP